MAKNPNSNPNKGFTGELGKASAMPNAKAKRKFTWHKQVAGGEASPSPASQNPASQTAVKPASSNLSAELASHIVKRKARA